MAVKIKLKRQGKIRQPYYRIVVADARTARDGRAIEEIGLYRPKEDPSFMQVDAERIAYWLSVGAQPTDAVTAILKVTGDWQKFKGEAPEPMKVRAPKSDKHAIFEAAAKDIGDEDKGGATTPKAKKAAPAPAKESTTAPETPAETVTAEDAAPTDAAPTEAVATDAVDTPADAAEPAADTATDETPAEA